MLMEIQGQETVSGCKNPLPVAEHSVTHTAETQYHIPKIIRYN